MAKRRIITNDPLVKLARIQRHVRQTLANGGQFYITDCFPQAIKPNCPRTDCPMRDFNIPVQSKPTAYHLQCEPTGDLADFLIKLRNTIDIKSQSQS